MHTTTDASPEGAVENGDRVDPVFEVLREEPAGADDDFWAYVDALDTHRSRLRERLTRAGLLRIAAAACVGAAVVVRLV